MPILLARLVYAQAQTAEPAGIAITTTAEVLVKSADGGRESYRLLRADHVVAGDRIVYTVAIRNAGESAIAHVVISNPVPKHMVYLENSATGPGASIGFSVDGGQHYANPDEVRIEAADGQMRAATGSDYTHIRWSLKYPLKGNSVAFARFCAVLR